jgi:O-methyltransferase involved in polyketide biosynthesis
VAIALTHAHICGGGLDLPPVQPIFEEYLANAGLSERLRFYPGDFFADDRLPEADVLIMGHILHDWGLDEKKTLLRKAHEALPAGGRLIVYETLIDDERRENAIGLLMSLTMLLETTDGFDYTAAECQEWMREAGFSATRVEHLVGPHSMVVATK